MAFVVFTAQPEISSVTTAEERIEILSDKIDAMQRDLEYILTHLDSNNMGNS